MGHVPWRKWAAIPLVAGLLGVAILTLVQVGRSAPAFAPELRRPGVTGDWRVADSGALYEAGGYYFQLGYGFLTADAMDLSRGSLASPDLAEARARQAEILLTDGLRLDPINAHLWQGLAEARASLGDLTGGRAALAQSWRLAPTSPELASARHFFLLGLSALSKDPAVLPLTSTERQMRASDRVVLERYAPDRLRDALGL